MADHLTGQLPKGGASKDEREPNHPTNACTNIAELCPVSRKEHRTLGRAQKRGERHKLFEPAIPKVLSDSRFTATQDYVAHTQHHNGCTTKVIQPDISVNTQLKTASSGPLSGQTGLQEFAITVHPARAKMTPARLFVASLGNPPPYSSTRHSAGHTLLKALQSYLGFPSFHKSKSYANGLTSVGADIGRPELTLWQSPSLMNVSGIALLKAYKAFMSATSTSATDPLPGLVILYDEMETAPSQLRLRRGATSAKGHNGLKSVQQTFQTAGLMNQLGDRYVKIGIGIGRPAGGSRTSDDVSQYVLGQLTGSEKQAIDGRVGDLSTLLETELLRISNQ